MVHCACTKNTRQVANLIFRLMTLDSPNVSASVRIITLRTHTYAHARARQKLLLLRAPPSRRMSSVLLSLPRFDDLHIHLRDGPHMASLVAALPRACARAVVMPNLRPPVTTTAAALAYKARILAALPPGADFEPLMTLYLTDVTSADEISRAAAAGIIGVKLYPAGATTNSDAGVTDVARAAPALARMAELGMPLLVHGEVTDAAVDIFEREPVFLERVLAPLLARHPTLRVVLEHITTKEAVAAVEAAGARVAATILRRTTCCSAGTRSSRAASGRTATACPSSSTRPTAARSSQPRQAGRHSFSLAPTQRRTRAARRSARAVRRAPSRRTRRSSCTRRSLPTRARSPACPPSRPSTARAFTGSRPTPRAGPRSASSSPTRRGPCPRRSNLAATSSCPCARARPCASRRASCRRARPRRK